MENKEPKSGAPSAASNNETGPKWADDEQKYRGNMLCLAVATLKLSDIITEYSCRISPINAKYMGERIRDLAGVQYDTATVIDDFMRVLGAGALPALDKHNPMLS